MRVEEPEDRHTRLGKFLGYAFTSHCLRGMVLFDSQIWPKSHLEMSEKNWNEFTSEFNLLVTVLKLMTTSLHQSFISYRK